MGQTLRTKARMLFSILLVGLLLVSCGTTSNTSVSQTDYKYTATVEIKDNVSKAEVEEALEGEVVGWYPQSGFATIKTNKNLSEDSISQQGFFLSLFNGISAVATSESGITPRAITPAAQNGSSAWSNGSSAWSNGSSAWSNGSSAWSNGSSAWSNGSSAWSNGSSAWSNGVVNGYFTDNKTTFENIKLFDTHAKSKNFGENVVVAVIDSGLDLDHPMFKDRLTPSYTWKDFVDGDMIPEDSANPSDVGYGHGTAVAGIILQVAPRAKILPIRVIGPDGTGDTEDIAAAIEHAFTNGAWIINLSLGTTEEDPSIQAMLSVANKSGALTVASAGNTGNPELLFPAGIANELSVNPEIKSSDTLDSALAFTGLDQTSVLGVSSVDASDIISKFSAYGNSMDLSAPGEAIVTAYPNGQYTGATGTSFAAPLVSGTLALGIAESNRVIAIESLLGLVAATAENVSNKNNSAVVNGAGLLPRLDTYSFLSWATGTDPDSTTKPTTEPVTEPTNEPKESIIYENNFDNGRGQFQYYDNVFSNTGTQYYARGVTHNNSQRCNSNNTCLQVNLEGKDNYAKYQVSGGYDLRFTLEESSEVTLSFNLKTEHAAKYESDEYVLALVYLDDHFVGNNGEIHLTKLIGGGVSTTNTGWVEVNKSLGVLAAGEHFITIGAYTNKMTYHDEISSIFIDDFKLTGITQP